MKEIYIYIRTFLVHIYLKFYKFYILYINKYEYKDELYEGNFLSKVKKDTSEVLEKAPEIIYVFWTGTNELTANREIGLDSLIKKSGVAVKLITPYNLDEYILDDFPLHEGFQYLSLVHKSDYLRCYFMLHHGGGYADIKPCLRSWKKLFSKLNNDETKWGAGVRELYASYTPNLEGKIGVDTKKYFNLLIGNGGFIYKPKSTICKQWMTEIHFKMDCYLEDYKKNPGGILGDYNMPWAHLAGETMHPLVLKYNDKILYTSEALYSTENYR